MTTSESPDLLIEQGIEKGRRIKIPLDGARIGRSSKNDVVIDDPKMSRHHCRIMHKQGIGLHVADLGSANHTLVNGSPIQEIDLKPGDSIEIGDTLLRVTQPFGKPALANIDLGLGSPAKQPTANKRSLRRAILIGLAVAVLLAASGIWLPKLIPEPSSHAIPITEDVPDTLDFVELHYEKVLASGESIFRYQFTLDADHKLTVRIDDTGNVHINETSIVKPELVHALAEFIQDVDFYNLDPVYEGISKKNNYESWVISTTINRRTHQVNVDNRLEPPVFRTLREKLEDFAHIELGLWAVAYSPEKLIELATNAYLEGRKLYDARAVKFSNLSNAIKSFKTATFYLKTLDPKPDFHRTILEELLPACEKELKDLYRHRNFMATRASSLREWNEAAEHLRVVLELVPNRKDERHLEARKLLLEVEDHLRSER
ncbi:MAG: pSer/pThr/pTyr-binding forkhead associated (FHA) protein [Candidatus Promineifilaceae bacterium]|jgi:pSer/pThr/pTyr-binding forkhead associated (FHA) protein